MKTVLILEGGAMRGIYTAGVLDVLMEHAIAADGVIGVSAGAVHGCNYVSGQRGRSIRYYKKYAQDPRFISVRSLLRTGNMVDTDFCYRELPLELDPFDNEAFMASAIPFYVVCTDVETGRAEVVSVTIFSVRSTICGPLPPCRWPPGLCTSAPGAIWMAVWRTACPSGPLRRWGMSAISWCSPGLPTM